jgi:plastocyanin
MVGYLIVLDNDGTQAIDVIMGEGETIAEVNGEEEIVAEFHRWEPGVIVVNKGDTVDLTVTNPRGNAHTLILPEFGVTTPRLDARGGSAEVSFIADKAGVFQYACGLPHNHETGDCDADHKRMVGYLIVLE